MVPNAGSQPRQTIVKFTNYKARSSVYRTKAKLKQYQGGKSFFIKEDLTYKSNMLVSKARKLKKEKKVKDTWTSDGKIFVKDFRDRKSVITRPKDILQYMSPQTGESDNQEQNRSAAPNTGTIGTPETDGVNPDAPSAASTPMSTRQRTSMAPGTDNTGK